MDVFKGLVMMAYPGYHGLGEWEPIRVLMEDPEDDHQDTLDAAKVALWVVGKEL